MYSYPSLLFCKGVQLTKLNYVPSCHQGQQVQSLLTSLLIYRFRTVTKLTSSFINGHFQKYFFFELLCLAIQENNYENKTKKPAKASLNIQQPQPNSFLIPPQIPPQQMSLQPSDPSPAVRLTFSSNPFRCIFL